MRARVKLGAAWGVVLCGVWCAGASGCGKRDEPRPFVAGPRAAAPTHDPLHTPAAKPPPRPNTMANWGSDMIRQRRAAEARAATDAGAVGGNATAMGGPNSEELNRAVNGAMGTLAGCFRGTNVTSAQVAFEADPSGKATKVQVFGGNPAIASCVSSTLGAVPLPKFTGVPVRVDLPLSVTQTETTVGNRIVLPPTQNTQTTYRPAKAPPEPSAFVQP